jgi:hypothetical protein
MAKEKPTPRSYVTWGFDILRPALIDTIGKILQNQKPKTVNSWWYDCIYTALMTTEKEKEWGREIPVDGDADTLHKILDESRCFTVCTFNHKIVSPPYLPKDGLNLDLDSIKKLRKIRNEQWAHSVGEGMTKEEAGYALQVMAKLMEKLRYIDEVERLKSIQEELLENKIRPIQASSEELIALLMDRVITPGLNSERCTDDVRRRLNDAKEYLEAKKTPEKIVDYFWYCINESTEGYNSYKKLHDLGLTTFEDIREEFRLKCYYADIEKAVGETIAKES